MREVIITEYPTKYWNPWKAGSRNRELKLALMKKYGVCYWCEKPVKDYPYVTGEPQNKPDMATIDHVVSRINRKKGEQVGKVLACFQCNNKRARLQQERKLL